MITKKLISGQWKVSHKTAVLSLQTILEREILIYIIKNINDDD